MVGAEVSRQGEGRSGPISLAVVTSIPLGFGGRELPVRYVDAGFAEGSANAGRARDLASRSAFLACKAYDVARGHFDPGQLSGLLTPVCLERLKLFARILEGSGFGRVRRPDGAVSYPPIVPVDVEVFAVGGGRFEMVVTLAALHERYQANVTMQARGEGWLCTLLDLG
ncbi:hypothetical protein [Bifidobacterium xylocopae]|uniref:Uncharacterized protein n=1 Tax=Bifidobacterium xylocopae TaxID=2493119 RepID=A0A366KCZ9_9BIFI|nr:hypothetical protein [Bifidobacterium xylocopae]RBP98993.1 hypothetical protein CRD59_06310 [Bifidobacterium xylocopae]